jgi:hypothetical protein
MTFQPILALPAVKLHDNQPVYLPGNPKHLASGKIPLSAPVAGTWFADMKVTLIDDSCHRFSLPSRLKLEGR